MGFDYSSVVQLPGIGQIIAKAIEDGEQWGQTFINDLPWKGDRDRMANHAIYESTLWSVVNGIWNGAFGLAGILTDIAITLYSQVKLASTLFTIYGIDIRSPSAQILVLAAAAGVGVAELANSLGTQVAKQAIQKSLMSISNKTFAQII